MSLSPDAVRVAFEAAGVAGLPQDAISRFSTYLDLLIHWNARLNLTAIREPESIIERHFLESIFAAHHLPPGIKTLLDYGSGAGFPGLPVAICRPDLHVTLAESQTKKSAFLREAVRVMGLASEVFAGRVEALPVERRFDAVILRAVENMETAIPRAAARADSYLLLMVTEPSAPAFQRLAPAMDWSAPLSLPNSTQMVLLTGTRRR